MASKARAAFDDNAKDIKRLMEIHEDITGTAPGRRYGVEVLNKSAIVLITAFWEAYCEDIAAEGFEHIIKHAKSADALPTELKKIIAKKLEAGKNELEVWKIADDGWRDYLTDHLDDLQEERNRKLNTPKTEKINELFKSAVGIKKMSSSWVYDNRFKLRDGEKKLDKYVTLRGAIAHRGKYTKSIQKKDVTEYFDTIQILVAKTGGEVNRHVKEVTGKQLWPSR